MFTTTPPNINLFRSHQIPHIVVFHIKCLCAFNFLPLKASLWIGGNEILVFGFVVVVAKKYPAMHRLPSTLPATCCMVRTDGPHFPSRRSRMHISYHRQNPPRLSAPARPWLVAGSATISMPRLQLFHTPTSVSRPSQTPHPFSQQHLNNNQQSRRNKILPWNIFYDQFTQAIFLCSSCPPNCLCNFAISLMTFFGAL